MPSLSRLSRRNPRWGEDGPVAQREHRRRLVRDLAAFATALFAVLAAGAEWAAHLGVGGIGRG